MEFKARPAHAYVETSVWAMVQPGQDPALRRATEDLLRRLSDGLMIGFVSPLVLQEIHAAPTAAARRILETIERTRPTLLEITEEAEWLADRYVEAEVVTARRRNDALHVAVATVEDMDIFVSWNYRHLANVHRADRFNAVNALHGFHHSLAIHTPLEVLDAEDA
jgi:predicted nucleic acid-binding protein